MYYQLFLYALNHFNKNSPKNLPLKSQLKFKNRFAVFKSGSIKYFLNNYLILKTEQMSEIHTKST
jgi:hypothetical protein